MTTKIGNLGIEALAGPTRLKARLQSAITGLDRQISLGYRQCVVYLPVAYASRRCRVEAGAYTIGSADGDPDAGEEEKPQHTVTFGAPFWIARYPITNVQWQLWVEQGRGSASYSANDSDRNHPNQQVVSIPELLCTMCQAFLK